MGDPTTKITPKTVRRYRINPLELVIFTLVTIGFGFSVFHLFRETGELQFATLQPMETSPNRKVPGRNIASVPGAVTGSVDGVAPIPQRINFEVNCAENPGFQFGDQNCPEEPTGGRLLQDIYKYHPGLNK